MKNKINLGTKFIAFLALFMFSILAINVSAKAGQMKMHAIYVDRGDAIVIESNGHFMLVDSGISQTSEKVLAYLKSLNIPDKKIVESKSLKLYLWSFRNEGVFHEHVTNIILDDLVAALKPRWCKVSAEFAVRGGIGITVDAEYKK